MSHSDVLHLRRRKEGNKEEEKIVEISTRCGNAAAAASMTTQTCFDQVPNGRASVPPCRSTDAQTATK